MRCPGSINFKEAMDAGADSGGTAADEGTILHSFAESALREEKEAYDYVGETREHNGYSLTLDDDLAAMIQSGLDYIDAIPGKLHIETRVDLKRWMPGQFGTTDVGIVGEKTITIFDWKFGLVPVSPIENEQVMIYALGFWDNIARYLSNATKFRLVIWQPRAPGGGGEWEISLDDLLAFGKEVKRKAAATYNPDAPRIAGSKQCPHCDGAKTLTCAEYTAFNLALVVAEFDELDEAVELDIPMFLSIDMTPERRSYILEHRSMFEQFLNRLYEQTMMDALQGRPTPGLKAVHGRNPPRKWASPEEAEAALTITLGDDAYTKKVVTPTQAEKLLSKKMYSKVASFVERGQPKPILVSDKDTRPAIQNLADMFDD
jgi:hypothetical protein